MTESADSVIDTPSVTGTQPVAGHSKKTRHPKRLVLRQITDSSVLPQTDATTDSQHLFPTDAKAREKERRKAAKEAGNEHVVKKRKKVMEDHHDDCGEDLSSLMDEQGTALCCPCGYDSDDILSDEDSNDYLLSTYGKQVQTYPVDLSKVARAQPGGTPSGPDSRASKRPQDCRCPGCRAYKAKRDWAHTRIIGECKYPYG